MIKHVLLGLLSIGLAFGINRVSRPQTAYTLDAGQRTLTTGALMLDDSGGSKLELVDLHVIAEAIPRTLADPLQVRELWIRGPQLDDATVADLELFVDLADGDPASVPIGARDIDLLVGRDLTVTSKPVWRRHPARVRLPGASEPAEVTGGSVRIVDAVPFDAPNVTAAWRVNGRVELVIKEGGEFRDLNGRFSGRVVWN